MVTPSEALQHIVTLVEASAGLKDDTQRKVLLRSVVGVAQKGLGDVYLAWENEAYLVLDEFGADNFETVYPPSSILAEPPVAVVDKNAALFENPERMELRSTTLVWPPLLRKLDRLDPGFRN